MRVIENPADFPTLEGTVGFVPTMGALHDGHASLITAARTNNDTVVVSVFVNPLQFNEPEDYDNYPRDLDSDLKFLSELGVDIVLAPTVEHMYPGGGPIVTVSTGEMGTVLEGASRPGHFDGVATVVAKLFNIVRPHRAYFGQKDAQQVAVVKRLVADLNLGVEILAAPIVRAADGLAKSSRNRRLSPAEREQALALPRALQALAEGADLAHVRARLAAEVDVDYLVVVDPETLSETRERPALALGAVWVGPVRLIDNREI